MTTAPDHPASEDHKIAPPLMHDSVETILLHLLSETLERFEADRAWLLFPCEPTVDSWRVSLERTRPEWPGASSADEAHPVTPEFREILRSALAEDAVFQFGPAAARPVPDSLTRDFHVRSFAQTVVRPAGGAPWLFGLHHCAAPRHLDQSAVAAFRGIAARISAAIERHTSWQKLRGSEERFRRLFELSPVAMALLTLPDGRTVEANSAAEQLLGFSLAEVRGQTSLALNLWVDPAERDRYLQSLSEHGAVNGFEAQLRTRDGRVLDTLCSASLMLLEGRRYTLNTVVDISERKRARLEAQRTREQFENLFEFAPDATLMVDAQGRVVRLNRRAEALFGYARGELIGQPIEVLVPETGRSAHVHHRAAFAQEPITRQMGSRSSSLFARRKDGSTFPCEISIGPVESDEGPLVAAAVRDITVQRAANEARRQAEMRLRQAQKLEALGTLAGGIAHDFNNILTGMLGFVDLARLDLPNDHRARTWLENTARAGERAKGLVQQILTFSRKAEGEQVPMRLEPVLQEAFRLLRSTIPPMIELDLQIAPDCPPVKADGTQLHQVVMNLCTNAWHASPESGSTIHIRLAPGCVTDAQAERYHGVPVGPTLVLTVQDHGCGMPPAVLERIFDPFFSTKPAGKGTGLGLAVVDGIVRSHGGAIHVESTPNIGTTFEIVLPALPLDAAPPVLAAADALPHGNGERVMLIDDEPEVRTAIALVLERLGYHVTQFADPQPALENYLTTPERFDLVITDLAMPHLSGADVARRVLAARSDAPVLLLSGFVDQEKQHELLALGVREILRKPPALLDLARAVHRCVAR